MNALHLSCLKDLYLNEGVNKKEIENYKNKVVGRLKKSGYKMKLILSDIDIMKTIGVLVTVAFAAIVVKKLTGVSLEVIKAPYVQDLASKIGLDNANDIVDASFEVISSEVKGK